MRSFLVFVTILFSVSGRTHPLDFDPKTDLSVFISERPLTALRLHGISKLGDLKAVYAARGIHWFRGIPQLSPKGLAEIERMEAFAWVRAGTRLDPALKPIDQLNLSYSTKWALHYEGLWNLEEVRERYRQIGREGFRRFDKMGGKSLDQIDALMSCADFTQPL